MEQRNIQKKADGIRRRVNKALRSSPRVSGQVKQTKSPLSAETPAIQKKLPQDEVPHIKEVANTVTILPEEEKQGAPPQKISSPQKTHVSFFTYFRKNPRILALCVGVVSLIASTVLLSTVFARLTVTIRPRVESLRIEDTSIIFDASAREVNRGARIIPSEFLEFTHTATMEFETSGREYIENKSRGKVKIYNAFSSSPQGLVAQTRFLSDSGILFRLPKSTVVPGAKVEKGKIVPQFIEIELIADKIGEGSNIDKQTTLRIPGFEGTPKYEGFYAVAPSGFSGGFKGEARVVSPEDVAKAQMEITKKVFDELKSSIAGKIPPPFKLVEGLREIEITQLMVPAAKTKGERFSAEAKAVGRVFVFRQADILRFIKEVVGKEEGARELLEESADLHYRLKNSNPQKKQAEVILEGTIKVKDVIAQQELVDLLKGKKEDSVVETLKQKKEISLFRLSFFPPWLFAAPKNAAYIHIVIEEPQLTRN